MLFRSEHGVTAAHEVQVAGDHPAGERATDLGGERVVEPEHLDRDRGGDEFDVARGSHLLALVLRHDRYTVDADRGARAVAEAFEEAFANPAEYPNGWIALQRVKQLWADIEPLGNETAKAEGRAALAALDGLYANQVPPATMAATGHTAEDAEAAAQRLAGVIEQIVQINLFPGRDLPALADHLTGLIGQACVAYDAGEDYIGQEAAYAAGHHYGQQLTGLGGVMNPILNAGIVELLGKLVSVDDLMEEPPELIAARNAKRRGPILDDDDDDAPQTEPGWLFCPDLESLMKRAAAAVRG